MTIRLRSIVALAAVAWGAGFATQSRTIAVGMVILVNIAVCILVERNYGWHGFKVGVLIGLPLSLLICVGTIFVLCGGMRI